MAIKTCEQKEQTCQPYQFSKSQKMTPTPSPIVIKKTVQKDYIKVVKPQK